MGFGSGGVCGGRRKDRNDGCRIGRIYGRSVAVGLFGCRDNHIERVLLR